MIRARYLRSRLRRLLPRSVHEIDVRIARLVGRRRLGRFQVHVKDWPGYRCVDVYRATEELVRGRGEMTVIESEHPDETLNDILHTRPGLWTSRRIKGATRIPWPVGPREEVHLPADVFWVSRGAGGLLPVWLVARVRHRPMQDRVVLEVAAEDEALALACLNDIETRATEESIYRNRVLGLSFEPGIKDECGDLERSDRLHVFFKVDESVSDDDIVIDDEVRSILWRNVVDLHRRREVLKARGVPVRRGVLLYGPPGTGKTFACRYLCGKLPETTRIVVAGNALLQVRSVFHLARMLQPSLVVLEDVDLVFSSREINLYSSVLGELLDQMDGLRPREDIGVVLTTNAIDRVEAAIKDRPGRISQCIYLGPPNDVLRRRYLLHHLRAYDVGQLTLDHLAHVSRGATQAFLKEWVHRSVQIAIERLPSDAHALALHDADFDAALREMRRFSEGTTGRIVGFLEGNPTHTG